MMRFWTSLVAAGVLTLALVGFSAGPVTPSPGAPASLAPADTGDFLGTWIGPLNIGNTSLRVVVHLRRSGDSLTATMDSPDQGATGIPVKEILISADTLRLGVPSIAAQFAGVRTEADTATVIDGQFAQGGARFPLTLQRTGEAPVVRRPQTPRPPFPYRVDTLRFTNERAGITLAGTLTRPDTDRPVPGVIIISGSGGQDRNGTIMRHEVYHVLADALTRQGIAVLRYDDRGIGQSGGTLQGSTPRDLSFDAQAALEVLDAQPKIRSVGLIGHSEGALIAPMLSNRSRLVDFLVLLAPPALPGDVLLREQLQRIGEAEGVDRRVLAIQKGTQQRIFEALKQDADSAEVASELAQIMRESQGISGEETIDREIRRLMQPSLRFFIRYDPRPALRQVDIPVLALTGSKDTQVPSDTTLTVLREALSSGPRTPPYAVEEMQGLNHLFQPATTGAPSEYGRIDTTLSPRVPERIGEWIRGL